MENTENQTAATTKILFVILGVVVVIVFGFILFTQYGGGLSEAPSGTTAPIVAPLLPPEEPAVVDPAGVAKIMREAIDTQDASLCEKLGKEKDKKSCRASVILAEAGIKEDPSICNQLEDQAEIMVCKDNVVITQAMNARDPSICNNMVDKTRIEGCKADVSALE